MEFGRASVEVTKLHVLSSSDNSIWLQHQLIEALFLYISGRHTDFWHWNPRQLGLEDVLPSREFLILKRNIGGQCISCQPNVIKSRVQMSKSPVWLKSGMPIHYKSVYFYLCSFFYILWNDNNLLDLVMKLGSTIKKSPFTGTSYKVYWTLSFQPVQVNLWAGDSPTAVRRHWHLCCSGWCCDRRHPRGWKKIA